MPTQILSAIVGAIFGAVSAFVLTWIIDEKRSEKRIKRVASAIVYELRLFKRSIERSLEAAKGKHVIFGSGFPDVLYSTFLAEIPNLGPDVFLHVRSVYTQTKQINYLNTEFKEVAKKRDLTTIPNLGESYESALKEGLENVNNALNSLKPIVDPFIFTKELPKLKYQTELEKIITNQ